MIASFEKLTKKSFVFGQDLRQTWPALGENSSSKMRKSSSISVDGIESPLLKSDSLEEKPYNAEKPSQYTIWQQSIAECIGTAILLAFGTGSVAQYLLTGLTDMTALRNHICGI